MKRKSDILLIITLMILAGNLRAPITGIGTLVTIIQDDLGLSSTLAGLITTLPIIVFAVVSPFASSVSRRIGLWKTIMAGLLFIFAGQIIRASTNTLGMFLGTAIMGVGIAIGNVLLVSLIKLYFPDKLGPVTSMYSTSMALIASVSIGISAPIAVGTGNSWRIALAVWIILALCSIVLWVFQKNGAKKVPDEALKAVPDVLTAECNSRRQPGKLSIYRSVLAWQFAVFMGLQSLLFFSITAWIPAILQSRGYTIEQAGFMALFLQLVSIPATFIVPFLITRQKTQCKLVFLFCSVFLVGFVLFFFAKNTTVHYISIICIAIGMGPGISFGNMFISLRTRSAEQAAALSGMGQSLGYTLAAVGPVFIGFIFDLTQSWTIPIIFLMVSVVILMITGMLAGRDRYVFDV